MNKIGMLLISMLFLSLAVAIKSVAGGATVVKVDPSLIEYHENATGQQFTVAIKIVDVTNLYGFDVQFRWNTTYLDYVSHSVHVPKDTYPDGVLWNPTIGLIEDEVNATAGTYWIASASMYDAPSFNGTGTVFNMTFRVKYHPAQSTTEIPLELYSTDLSNKVGAAIPHTPQNGKVILYALIAGHDVSVTHVNPWKTTVGQGYSMNINVTVANQGDFTETFNITAYANTTSIASQNVTLSSGNFATLTFTWNTSGFAKGKYTLSAYARPVPGETDTTDNTFVNGAVKVAIVGDINGDGQVNILDAILLGNAFDSKPGEPTWSPNADLNGDGYVNILDAIMLGNHFDEKES